MRIIMDMKCIIVHGCPGLHEKQMDANTRSYDKHWMPWLKKQLDAKGIPTEMPLMPDPWEPDYEKFKSEFDKYEVTEDTVLVGHSCGCAFLVQWLCESKSKVLKLILVAPWKTNSRPCKFRDAFYGFPIDQTIKDRVGEIVMFTADD